MLEREEQIIGLMKKNPKINKIEISNKTNIPLSTVKRLIKNSKRIYYIGLSKNGHWTVVNNVA